MIEGYVNVFEQPIVELVIKGSRSEQNLYAIVDTGFDGDLCIPIYIAIVLGLELKSTMHVELADGTLKRELVFKGIAKLEEEELSVEILLTESDDALIGTHLLRHKKLCIDFENETVNITCASPSDGT
ncbi:MAG: hypothetical protein ACE5J9_03965 [Methanosarcinales archaeon]